ncbi:MAG: ferritin-like domain-containing protein [Candidatus Sulfomarinibacteraceae bacterium]
MVEYHEKWDALSPEVRDLHRAIKSLQEELEAVDWYHQRVALTDDEDLRRILEHNRNEEIEHAAMIVEWLRRNMDGWDKELETYLFTDSPVVEVEEDEDARGTSLGIGKPKGGE